MRTLPLTASFIQECKTRLLGIRKDILNQFRASRSGLETNDVRSGDEADQTAGLQAEHDFLIAQARWQHRLAEIDSALGRIENGKFGICEETEERIEVERLRAIPWTRLSIEGAELREALDRRFARV
jgi:DnaK suppressor protein